MKRRLGILIIAILLVSLNNCLKLNLENYSNDLYRRTKSKAGVLNKILKQNTSLNSKLGSGSSVSASKLINKINNLNDKGLGLKIKNNSVNAFSNSTSSNSIISLTNSSSSSSSISNSIASKERNTNKKCKKCTKKDINGGIGKGEGGESAFGHWGNKESMEQIEFYIDSQVIPISLKDSFYNNSSKHRKSAKYFLSKLLSKLYFSENVIEKCIQAPSSTFAKILDIIYRTIRNHSYGRLFDKKDSDCPAIDLLANKLKDKKVLRKVKIYFNQHVKRIISKV